MKSKKLLKKFVLKVVVHLKENPSTAYATEEFSAESDDTATISDIRRYVYDAVSSWGGQFPPNHALFSGNIGLVEVSAPRVGQKIARPTKRV